MIPRAYCSHAGLFIASLGAPAAAAEASTVDDDSSEPEPEGSHGHHYNDILSVKVAYVEALDEVEAEREGEARLSCARIGCRPRLVSRRQPGSTPGPRPSSAPTSTSNIEHRWVPSEHRIYDLTLAIGASARF